MKAIHPRIASEALRYAKTAERALQIERDGYTFWTDEEIGLVAVCKPGRLAASYWINLLDEICDCPDFCKRGDYCKHLLAVDLQQQEAAQIAQYERQMRDAECSTGCDAYAKF